MGKYLSPFDLQAAIDGEPVVDSNKVAVTQVTKFSVSDGTVLVFIKNGEIGRCTLLHAETEFFMLRQRVEYIAPLFKRDGKLVFGDVYTLPGYVLDHSFEPGFVQSVRFEVDE